MAIDYGLGVRQAAYDRYVAAEGQKSQAEAKAKADRERRSRQKSRGLMSLAANAGLAFATGGASIPYSGMVSQTLMGDDYEGSGMQSLSGLASAAYSGVSAMKGKAIKDMQSAHDAKMNKMYKSLDALEMLLDQIVPKYAMTEELSLPVVLFVADSLVQYLQTQL